MKLILIISLCTVLQICYSQNPGQYVFQTSELKINAVATYPQLHIGVGQFYACGGAYIGAVSKNNELLWKTSFPDFNYSFFTDVVRVNDSIFYAVGEEWEADDVPVIISMFIVCMNINGKLIYSNRITGDNYLSGLYGWIPARVKLFDDGSPAFSYGNRILFLNPDCSILDTMQVSNQINDFAIIDKQRLIYISDSEIHQVEKNTGDILLRSGLKFLTSIYIHLSSLYFIDESFKLFSSEYDGSNLKFINDSLQISEAYYMDFDGDTAYLLGLNKTRKSSIIFFQKKDYTTIKAIDLSALREVAYKDIAVDENDILISGICDYGRSNPFFYFFNPYESLPQLTQDIKISDYKQTGFSWRLVDSFNVNFKLYEIGFTFQYKITNNGKYPVTTFEVYSDNFDGINCFQIYYHFKNNELIMPGEELIIYGSASVARTTSLSGFQLCLRAVAPDFELDKNPEDNINCLLLTANDDTTLGSAEFELSPNPANEIININSRQNSDYIIYNSTGVKIIELKNIKDSELNINEYFPGIYFLTQINTSGKKITRKFVKM
jgi:hypothetical protein